jgi:hypothetical protein
MLTVVIALTETERELLVSTLFDVANNIDPIVGWEDPEEYYEEDAESNGQWGEAYPVRGRAADYAEHPLLPLAQAICWYTPTDVYGLDGGDLAVKTDVNFDIFIAELTKLGCEFSIRDSHR